MPQASPRPSKREASALTVLTDERQHGVADIPLMHGEPVMKTIVSALIALSVLAGIAAPVSALDTKTFYEQQDRQSY